MFCDNAKTQFQRMCLCDVTEGTTYGRHIKTRLKPTTTKTKQVAELYCIMLLC